MRTADPNNNNSPSELEHDLERHFPELLAFDSTAELEASKIFAVIKPEYDRIMNMILVPTPVLSTYGHLHGTSNAGAFSRVFLSRSKLTMTCGTKMCFC
jgi:hypothetical protein